MCKAGLKSSKLSSRAAALASTTAVFLFILSGCSLNRVMAVKKQFCDFDSNFSYSLSGRPEIVFANPVILDSDVEWVIGYEPTHILHEASGVVHSYVFEKLHATEDQSFRFDLHYQLNGSEARLKSVQLPQQITSLDQFAVFDHGAEIAAAASKICNYRFRLALPSIEEDISPAQLETLPSREELIALLGQPGSGLEEGALVYEYQIKGQTISEPAFRMAVWYDENGARPLHMEARYRMMGSRADFVQGKVHHFYGG